MSWRTVVVSHNAKLDYENGYLVVRGEETKRIFINEIGLLLLENTAVAMTGYLLAELVRNKVKVIFCDQKRNPCAELVPYYGSHDTSAKVRSQIQWSEDIKGTVWTEIVSEKIRKQSELLLRHGMSEGGKLQGYLSEVAFGDSTNREGHAAKVYFNALFGKKFTRAEDTPINAALNYGYSLILSLFTREISANGYLTQLGLFHDNMFNQFNLASDLMEPFRPLVDERVLLNLPDKFETEEKHKMLELLEQEVFINDRSEHLGNAVKIYTRSVFDALEDKDASLIRFYQNEL
jgi:CRISP-associated protein Cas1